MRTERVVGRSGDAELVLLGEWEPCDGSEIAAASAVGKPAAVSFSR